MRQQDKALSLVAGHLAGRSTRSAVGSQLRIENKALVGVVRRASVI